MKTTCFITTIIFLSVFNFAQAQSLAPNANVTSGGYFTGGGASLSWTMGETFNTTLQGGSKMLSQGEQQPYILVKILNLKTFLEGFYLGSGQMRATLYNTGISADPTACDSITIELHGTSTPFNLVASTNALLHVNGTTTATFPSSLLYGSYYVVIRHRNSLQTWSKDPFTISTSASVLNFTN